MPPWEPAEAGTPNIEHSTPTCVASGHRTLNLKTLSAGAPKGTGAAPVLPGTPNTGGASLPFVSFVCVVVKVERRCFVRLSTLNNQLSTLSAAAQVWKLRQSFCGSRPRRMMATWLTMKRISHLNAASVKP